MNSAIKAYLNASLYGAVQMNATPLRPQPPYTHECECGKQFVTNNRYQKRCDDCRAKDQPKKAEKFKHWTKRK